MANKIFDFDGRTGQLIDQITGNSLTNTGVKIKMTDKGLSPYFDRTKYLYQNNRNELDRTQNISWVIWYKQSPESYALNNYLFTKGDYTAGGSWQIEAQSTGAIIIRNCNPPLLLISNAVFNKANKYYCAIITLGSSNDWSFYNGITPVGSGTLALSVPDNRAIAIGSDSKGSSFFGGNIMRATVFDGVLDSKERTHIYEDFLHSFQLAETKRNFVYEHTSVPVNEQTSYRNTFMYDKADGITINHFDMLNGTGEYMVKTGAGKENYLECNSNGTISYQSKQTYGTWEFDWRCASNVNGSARMQFISLQNKSYPVDAYGIDYAIGGKLRLFRISNGGAFISLFVSNSYIELNTSYRIKITRDLNGEFTVYIKRGLFGNNYVIIDTSGGSGSNPVIDNTYTKGKYTVLDFDIGDRVSNILYSKGVV